MSNVACVAEDNSKQREYVNKDHRSFVCVSTYIYIYIYIFRKFRETLHVCRGVAKTGKADKGKLRFTYQCH